MKQTDPSLSVIQSHLTITIFILGISLVIVLVVWAVILLSRGVLLPPPPYRPHDWLWLA